MQPEYESLASEQHVQQGDLFIWHDRYFQAPWNTYGVVVTADCDLLHRKHGGQISYVPAFLTMDYIWQFWRPAQFEGLYASAKSQMAKRLNKLLSNRDPERLDASEDALTSWALRVGPNKMLDELGVDAKGDRNRLKPMIEAVIEYVQLLSREQPSMELLRSCHQRKMGCADGDESLIKEFQKGISQLPGDVFHLPTLPDRDDDGLFLLLRHIRQCTTTELALTPDDLRSGRAKARRLARVAAPYRYAITQNLARVFAEIGLPEQYGTKRKSAASRFFSTRPPQ